MANSTDPIANFLTQIRNAMHAGKASITVPGSKLTLKIAEILKKENYIENFKLFEDKQKKSIRVHLRYVNGKQPAIQSLIRVSKPGLRQYYSYRSVPRVLGGLGVAILSTSKGVITDREARAQKLGGELLCKVW